MTLEYQNPRARIPLSQRINLRMIVFIGVIVMLVGYPVYTLIDAQLTGGIKDIGGGYKLVDLKAMSTYTFDQDNGSLQDIPDKWRALNGQKVVLYGELWQPTGVDDQMQRFDLCYSIAKCCFNGPPQVQHFVHARVLPGKSAQYHDNLVKVTGILHVDVKKDAGKVASVYQLDADSVEAVQ